MPNPDSPMAGLARAEPAPLELDAAAQSGLLNALAQQLQTRWGAVQRIDTHLSSLLLAGGQVWKFNRVLDLGFVNFLSLAARGHDVHEAWRLNRRLAPDLYLGVVRVTGRPEAPELDGTGPLLDWALHLRAFAPADLWSERLAQGRLSAAEVDALAQRLAQFQAQADVAPVGSAWGHPQAVRGPALDNLRELPGLLQARPGLDQAPDLLAPARECLPRLAQWEQAQWQQLAPQVAARQAQGHVREGHGDLHLANLITWSASEGGAWAEGSDRPPPVMAFDGISFNTEFRWIDEVNDIAFLVMDLQRQGAAGLAHRFTSAWAEARNDHAGLTLLRYYTVYRALVRAKVAGLRRRQCLAPGSGLAEPLTERASAALAAIEADIAHTLAWADHATRPAAPRLFITHGVSGSGKSQAALALVQRHGALRLRADVERKRLAGLRPEQPGPASLYSAAHTQATYARLFSLARELLKAGFSVVLDASFLQRHQRDAARALAAECGVPLHIRTCQADPETLRQRLAQRAARGQDPSDANAAVLAQQLAGPTTLDDDERPLQLV